MGRGAPERCNTDAVEFIGNKCCSVSLGKIKFYFAFFIVIYFESRGTRFILVLRAYTSYYFVIIHHLHPYLPNFIYFPNIDSLWTWEKDAEEQVQLRHQLEKVLNIIHKVQFPFFKLLDRV